jgi:hypothetical protein
VSRSKFRNVRTEIDGITFSSKAEARRYQELKLLEKAKAIHSLELQPRYKLIVNGELVAVYVGDFHYWSNETDLPVVEDVKGFITPEFRLKKKLMKACHGIEIQEIGGKPRRKR